MKLIPFNLKSIKEEVKIAINIVKNSARMTKIKENDFPHIDFDNGVMYGVMQQIKQSNVAKASTEYPGFITVWCCNIKPQQSKDFISFIREFITPYDNQGLTHLKRFQKIPNSHGTILKSVIASGELFESKEELLDLLQSHAGSIIADDIKLEDLYSLKVPSSSPPTKEMAVEWSEKYWPIAWKGNPNIQHLKGLKINIKHEKQVITKLLNSLRNHVISGTKSSPVATIIRRDGENESLESSTLVTTYDCSRLHPLDHSIMVGIKEMAEKERQSREQTPPQDLLHTNYLLTNLTIYTTHEPCVMCSMALVHSRIDRIIYIKPMNNGGLESNYQLGDRDGLNWKFDIWRWTDPSDIDELNAIEDLYKKTQRF